jgi:hypothetical protein
MSNDEHAREMYFRHREERDKYAYFLLAAAGSALAFAVQKTDSLTLHWSMMPLACSAILWIASFYFGCKRLLASQEAMRMNYGLLQMASEIPAIQKALPMYQEVRKEFTDAVDSHNIRSTTYAKRQFIFLIVGVAFFIAWHVWAIFARTFGASAWAN